MARMYQILGAKHAKEGREPLFPDNEYYVTGYSNHVRSLQQAALRKL